MAKFDLRLWGIRVRKILIASLILPLFTVVSAPQNASATFQTAGDGSCIQDVNTTTGVTVTVVGGDCVVTFTAPTNATTTNTWVVPSNGSNFQILVVGGGGGGGPDGGNGGGGGELRYSAASPSWIPSAGTELTLQVGAGGAAGSHTPSSASAAGILSRVSWGGSARFTANPGGGGGGWTSDVVALGGTGGSGGTGTAGQSATALQSGCGNLSATQNNTSGKWYTGLWFLNGGSGAGTALTTTAPTNSITGSDRFYGGAGGGGWGGNVNSASVGPIYGLAGGGTVNNVSTSGGRGSNWRYIPGDNHTTSWNGASAGAQGVDSTGGGGGGGNACDPTMNGSATTNGSTKRTAGGRGGSGVIVIRYTPLIFTVSFDANGGSGSPSVSSVSQIPTSNTVTLATVGTLTRSGFRFLGWNTQANGLGLNYAAGSIFTPQSNATLFAQWRSTIQYDPNTASPVRSIESTTAVSSSTTTTLSNGRLVRGSPIANGLILNLDAADSSTISASTWTNKVSGGTNATIMGSPTYSASEGAFSLNGSSQYFDLGDSAFSFTGTQNYTINVAYKNNEPMKETGIFVRHNAGVVGNYRLMNTSGKFLVQREISPWEIYSNSYIDPSQINYMTAVYNGSTLSVFVNGVADGSIAMTGTVGTSTIKTLIGARLNSGSVTSHLNGKIYSVQVYNRALSSAEISTNYQQLVPEAQVSKNNFTLAGWSTESSSGTLAAGAVTDLSALPTPYLRLLPQNFNAALPAASRWTATNGSGAGFSYTGTTVYNATGGGNFGASRTFPTISGPASAGIRLNNPTLTTYTLCVVARYKDVNGVAGSRGRLINSSNSNWISGFYNGLIRQFHHEAWNYDGGTTDLNWHYYCDSGNKAVWDGVKTPTWTYRDTTSLPPLAINWDPYAQNSDWELAEMIIYDQFLSDSAIDNVSRYFKNRYGIVGGAATSNAGAGIAPVTNYASSGDATLYAVWGSTITYDGNGQTSGTPPATHVITGASGTLTTNTGSLAKAGYKFAGWNTSANGSGTFYAPGATYSNTGNVILYAQYSKPLTFPTQYSLVDPLRLNPYMRFKASDYNATSKIWLDSSGNGRSTSAVRGSPSVVTTTTGNGNSKTFQVVVGGTSDGIKFGNPTFSSSTYTLITVARYSGVAKKRIFDGDGDNYLHGFYNGASGVAHHNGWVTGGSDVHGSNWVLGTSFASNYRSNGTSRGSSGGTTALGPLSLNYGTFFASEASNFEVAEVLIFNYQLNSTQIAQVEDYLSQTYGVALASPGSYPASQNLAIGAGVGGRSETFTAIDGFGTRTVSMSPIRSGFTLDTSTANSGAIVVSPTVATGTYTQNLIVTDGLGDTATYPIVVTASPAVKFDTSTATTLITTHRKGATLRLNTVFGVGTKVFTMTPVASGISLDTSTAASGFATLRVDTFTASGTFTQSITVTDDTKLRSTYTVTILINAPPTISSTSAIVTSPVLNNLRLNLDAGDQASYSGSGTTWTDLSGSGNNATWQVTPTFSTAQGGTFTLNGSTQFATTSSISTDVFTVEVWAKFDALNNNYACLVTNVYTGDKINYSICFRGNSTIAAAYHQNGTGWVGGQTGAFTPVVGTWYQFVYTVAKSGLNYIGTLYVNNTAISGTTTSTIAPTSDAAGIRIGRRWDSGEYINGSIPVVRIYNRALSATEITQNYNALSPRFTNNPSNVITVTTTESVTASSSVFYAGLGTGDKTFALSNATAGISIDTATVNTVRVNLANTLTATSTTVARSNSQIITATDTSGVAAATPVYVTTVINPKIIITDITPGTLSTTFGRVAYDTFTATQGTGLKTFTVVSSSFPSAFTMTNPSSNVGLLTVANNLPAGTYTLTITATDTVGATTNFALTVVVNPVPTIAGATGNTLTTTLARSATMRINVLGGTGTRTISWNSPQSGITLDTSTLAAQNFITLTASSAVPVRTYSFTIAATDSASARVSDTFTVIVNRWPVIGSDSVVQNGLVVNLDASTYSGTGNWLDTSGAGRNASGATASTTPAGTAPDYSTESGGIFSFNEGAATTNHMLIPNPGTLETFTVSTWVRFKSIPTNNAAIITQYWPGGSNTINYVLAFSGSSIYGAYYRGSSNWTTTTTLFTPVINTWYHLSYLVYKSGANYFQDLYVNGVKQGASDNAGTIAPTSNGSVISLGRRWDFNATAVLNGAYGNVSIYDRALSASEILQNYNATGARYISTNSGRETVTVTQGLSGAISSVLATQGTGTKTFTTTNASAGITIDTATANAFTLNLANTLTSTSATVARTITETVTATDAAGATTSRVYSIVINPPVRVESTTGTITTTSGIISWDTFTATQGTGLKTFTLTGTPTAAGFTLTQANNQAVLKVEPTVNPGTYLLTITARDSLGATTSITKTVVVVPGPILIGSNSLITARGFAFRSLPYSVTNGIATYTYTLASRAVNPPGNSTTNITFDTPTMTLRVAESVSAGTYIETLTVRDSRGATSSLVINLDVRPPAVLSGSLSITKSYGESSISNYTVSSATGVPPFTFTTSTPTVDNVCAPITGTYIGNGTNGVLGRSYTYEKFTGFERCNWIAPTGISSVDYVVVGGGGGGGNGRGGGGGGGGVASGTGLSITPGTVYDIAVAQGGTATNDGNDSWIGNFGATSLFVKANGGGAGGSMSSDLATITGNTGRSGAATVMSAGGSGGGGGNNFNNGTAHLGEGGAAGTGTVSGNIGGNSYRCDPNLGGYSDNSDGAITGTGGRTTGGGGGAGAAGVGFNWSTNCPTYNSALAPNGGAGVTSLLTGSAEVYGGGGGGSDGRSLTKPSSEDGYRSTGGGFGAGGGGNGQSLRDSAGENLSPARLATSGAFNTGGGGGGGVSTAGSGGSGVVVVRYETPVVDSVTVQVNTVTNGSTLVDGSVVISIPERTPAGSVTSKLIRLYQNGAYTNYLINVTINKETPTALLSLPGAVTTAKYGTPITVSSIASTAGKVGFKNGSSDINGCTEVVAVNGLATCEWTPSAVGATTIKAILTPTDAANYNSSREATLAVTVAKADTLTVTVLSQTETFTGTANDGNSYLSATSPTNAGIYTISPNYPTNALAFTFGVGSAGTTSAITNYESVTVVSGTLTVKRKPQTMVFTYPNSNSVTYSPTATLTSTATTRLGTGTQTYSTTTPITCSIGETAVVTVRQAGTCSVQMAVALTANYEADTATRVITINKASRTFVLTPGVSTLKFADTTTVTATLSGGSADGTISYTLGSPAGCTFDPLSRELVAISGTIQCPLTATISEGINYLAETATAISLTIARANAPVITIDTITALSHTPGIRAQIMPNFRVTGLKNLDTADSLTYTYGFVSNPFETFTYSDTRTPIDAGTYSITPSALTLSSGLISNYETPTYSSSAINVVINRIVQETVTIQSVNGEVDVPFTLIATGGSTSGVITFAKVSGTYCSVSGTILTATQAGSCFITVTRAGNRNYLPFTSESVTVKVRNYVMVQIYVPENSITGITITPTVPVVKGPNTCSTRCVPKIISADVYDVAEGDLIVLTGQSFNGVTKVYFNIYTEAPNFNVDSDTQISVRVPANLPQGDATIEVVSPGGTSNRLFDFIILP